MGDQIGEIGIGIGIKVTKEQMTDFMKEVLQHQMDENMKDGGDNFVMVPTKHEKIPFQLITDWVKEEFKRFEIYEDNDMIYFVNGETGRNKLLELLREKEQNVSQFLGELRTTIAMIGGNYKNREIP